MNTYRLRLEVAECWETTLLLYRNEITWQSGVRFVFPFAFTTRPLPVDCPFLPHFMNIFVPGPFSAYSSLHKLCNGVFGKKVPLFNFLEFNCRLEEGGVVREEEERVGPRALSDRPGQPIGSPSASAPLCSGGGRGRAGRLPKTRVRVGVNGWRREAGASMSGTGALDQHSWAGIGHTAGSGLHSSTKQDCEKRGK